MAGDLIAAGHPDPLRYTPRQAWTWWRLAQHGRHRRRAEFLQDMRMVETDAKTFTRYLRYLGA